MVAPGRRRRGQRARGRSSGAACCCCSSCCSWSSSRCSPRGRSSSDRPGSRATSWSSSTPRPAWPPRTSARTGSRRPRRPPSTRCATCRPAARSASSPPTGAHGSWSTRRPTSGGSARRSTASRCRAAAATSATRSQLAGKLAARSGDAQILVATDGALATPLADAATVPATVTVLPVGRERKNQAIVALAVRTAPVGGHPVRLRQRREPRPRARRPPARGLGRRRAPRGPRPPARRAGALRRRHRRRAARRRAPLELRLVGADPAVDRRRPTSSPSTTTPGRSSRPIGPRLILVVGAGRSVPRDGAQLPAERRAVRRHADEYGPATERQDGRPWDLVIFEGALPATLPRTPDPGHRADRRRARSATSPARSTNPGIGSLDPDEPILRYVDLSTTHIAAAAKLTLPDWARTVIPGPAGAPLLYAGTRAGLPTAVLAFEPRTSDLPLQVAFPILLANLTGELLGGSQAPTEAVQPGHAGRPGHPGRRDRAGGRPARWLASSSSCRAPTRAASVTFAGTDLPGIYIGHAAPRAGAPSGRRRRCASARPTPSGRRRSGSAAPAAPSAPPVDPNAPIRFAVDLFDVDESTIAPGSAAAIEALGVARAPGASARPGRRPAAEARPTTRDELWIPIVLLVLIGLCVEWAVYHRDALIRLRRGFGARFGRGAADGGT